MSLRPSELTRLADEAHRELIGAVVQKAWAPTTQRCYLEVRTPGRSSILHFCVEPNAARASAVEARPPNPPNPPGWQAVLRRELVGLKLSHVEADGARRVLMLVFEKPGHRRALVLDVGAPAQLVVLTEGRHVLCVSAPAREGLRPGAHWQQPEALEVLEQPSRLVSDFTHLRLWHGAETLFTSRERDAAVRNRRAPLEAKLKRLERTKLKVQEDLGRTDGADALRREGELLARNLWQLTRGAVSATLTEYLADAEPRQVEVALDPRLTPQQEVERRFHQYRRLQRGALIAQERLHTLEQEAAAIRAVLETVELENAQLPTIVQPLPRKQTPARAQPYRIYFGHAGHPIWVGRGAAHNDTLTFGVARPHHLWLHARGIAGAHVVVPLEKRAVITQELLLDAAHLAVFHSAAKSEPRVEVSYLDAKFVRKPKGAAPGAVTYANEKTFVVRVEPARLKRLLASEDAPR